MAGRAGSYPLLSSPSPHLSRHDTRKSQFSTFNLPSPSSEKDNPLHEKPLGRLSMDSKGTGGNESAIIDGDLSQDETDNFRRTVTRTQSRLLVSRLLSF